MDATPTTSNGRKERTGAAEATPVPTPPRIDYEVHMLEVGDVFESPLNPRKRFTGLEDLATDIRIRGIIEPLVVRKRKGEGYELAAGARRFRAAKMAQLKDLPCLMRTLTDAELLELALAENGDRDDLHAIEEAEGWAKLIHDFKYTREMLMAKFTKSRSHVDQRLQLLRLAPELSKACLAGELDTTVAIYASRIPSHDMQRDYLKTMHVDLGDKGMTRPTSRMCIETIKSRYMLRLIDAPFDRNDAGLVSAAGDCNLCPKRTGNQGELFTDVTKAPDMCTDKKCFEKKSTAAWDARAKTAKADGIEVIKEIVRDWAGAPSGFVALDDKCVDDKQARTYRQLLKGAMPKLDAIAQKEGGKVLELLKASTARKALVEAGHRFAKPSKSAPSRPKAKASPKPKPVDKAAELLEEQIEKRAFDSVVSALVVAAAKKKTDAFLRFLIADVICRDSQTVLERRGLKGKLEHELAKMKEDELRGFIIEDAIVDSCYDGTDSFVYFEAKKITEFLGVDAKAICKLAKEAVLAEAKKVEPPKKTVLTTTLRGGKKTTVKKGRKR